MYPSQPAPLGAIGLELRFTLGGNVTSSNFFMRKYNTWVELDGVAYERSGGAWHQFPVVPGWHLVRVFFRLRPGFLSPDKGSRQLQVLVPPNTMVRLLYQGGIFWPLTPGTLSQVG